MQYFKTEAERRGSLWFEFQKGDFQHKYWLNDSLYLYADTFDELKLFDLFSKAIPHFEYYGLTKVTIGDWQALLTLAHDCGGEKEKVVMELAPWAEACFEMGNSFTICGI